MNSGISDLKLEQWLLGELSEEEARTLEAIIREDDELRSRIDAMKAHNTALFHEHPTAKFEADVKRKIHEQHTQAEYKNKNQGFWRISLGIFAFCVSLLVLIPSVSQNPEDPLPFKQDHAYREKGARIHLVAHRVEADKQDQLFDGNAIQNGDQIQLSIKNAKGYSFVVFSLDGRGVLSVHYPIANGGRLEERDSFSLPTSYRLDDAPTFENFYLVASKKVLEREKVLAKARNALDGSDFQEAFQAQFSSDHTFNQISLRKEGK